MATETYFREAAGWRRLRDGFLEEVSAAARFPGDPGEGNFYVGWDGGPRAEGSLANGELWSPAPLSVWHDYSTATNDRVHASKLDTAISNNMIASQSFKLGTWSPSQIVAGSADSAIDLSIQDVLARAPWPIWLSYYHEPEDNFTTSTTAAQYRAAFRYIVQRFRAAGVTNVAWQPIYQVPWTSLTNQAGTGGDADGLPDGAPSGGSNRDWRWWHPDWNGGNTKTIADWYTGEDRVCDLFGLDVYNPMPGPGATGTSYTFSAMCNYAMDDIRGCGLPEVPYTVPEFGMSYRANPQPNWLSWCQAAVTFARDNNIVSFQYWNHSTEHLLQYDFSPEGDPTGGTKLQGWEHVCNNSVTFLGG